VLADFSQTRAFSILDREKSVAGESVFSGENGGENAAASRCRKRQAWLLKRNTV
jgi:hypothetical protein